MNRNASVRAGFNVNRFIDERSASWRQLESVLARLDDATRLSLDETRQFARLYRRVSSDLILARGKQVDADIVDYLNGLVGRAYAHVYATHRGSARASFSRIRGFFAADFPRLVRAEWRPIALSTLLFFLGSAVGAVGVAVDPSARGVFIPEQHQAWTPEERVARDEGRVGEIGEASTFSAFLFTHNIKVTFLVFAMGVTFGVGTAILMFYNGLGLGALAVQYHLAGHGLFFWAWILPHGVPELTQVFIAGGAGLIVGRGLAFPGMRPRMDALRSEAGKAVRLVLGGMPILIGAGLIEGTLSQVHEPTIPYVAKLLFAALVAVSLYAYLWLAGRREAAAGAGSVPDKSAAK